jgi:hypothetical protein
MQSGRPVVYDIMRKGEVLGGRGRLQLENPTKSYGLPQLCVRRSSLKDSDETFLHRFARSDVVPLGSQLLRQHRMAFEVNSVHLVLTTLVSVAYLPIMLVILRLSIRQYRNVSATRAKHCHE